MKNLSEEQLTKKMGGGGAKIMKDRLLKTKRKLFQL